jgi:hypothetical protein
MSYRPVFNNNCFKANSMLFIPTFKSLRKPTLSNSKATLSGLGSKGPDEQEAHEELRARREELKKFTDESTMPPTSFQDQAQVHLLIMMLSSQQLHARNHHHPSPPIHHHTFSQPRCGSGSEVSGILEQCRGSWFHLGSILHVRSQPSTTSLLASCATELV